MVLVNVQNQVFITQSNSQERKQNALNIQTIQSGRFVLYCFLFVFTDFQSRETAQKSLNPRVNQLTVCTPLNLIICLPLMYSVTK